MRFLIAVFILAFSLQASATHVTIDDIHGWVAHLKTPWRDSQKQTYGEIADPDSVNSALPDVLLIGDSISYGYTEPVRLNLDGHANVYRVPDNCRSSFVGRYLIQGWLDDRQYDVIHFNFGVWDLTHKLYTVTQYYEDRNWRGIDRGQVLVSPWQYERNLRIIVDTLRQEQPGAMLIFATTTPVTKDSDGRVVGTEGVYNDIAIEVMQEKNVKINDLHSDSQNYLSQQKSDGVHWNQVGSGYLADKVSQEIMEEL